MADTSSHFLEGKKIIVAGDGVAGSAFVAALSKLWDPTLTHPEIIVFDRDTREQSAKREGYSLSLEGSDKHGGLVALQNLGLIDEINRYSIFGLDSGRFKMWDRNWKEIVSVQPKPWGNLPAGSIRIARRDLRRIMVENAEKAKATFHLGCACTSVERVDNGRIQVAVTDQVGETSLHECDLLVAADGANSKIRAILRPNDKLVYNGAIQMGGNGRFPNGLPSPLGENWGLILSGQGVRCFFSAVDKERVVWAFSQREPERKQRVGGFSPDEMDALKREILERGHMFAEPFKTIVEATDPASAFMIPCKDKQPIRHEESLEGVVFIGDANHTVSPFARAGANLALKDGWDLAECLWKASSLKAAVAEYDSISYPRAVATLKKSHQRIEMGHCTGIKYILLRLAGLVSGRLFMWLTGT